MNEGTKNELTKENLVDVQKSLVSYHVGNYLKKATLVLKEGGNVKEMKEDLDLILKLGIEGFIIEEVLELIEKSDWSTEQGLENFRKEYLEFEAKHGIKH